MVIDNYSIAYSKLDYKNDYKNGMELNTIRNKYNLLFMNQKKAVNRSGESLQERKWEGKNGKKCEGEGLKNKYKEGYRRRFIHLRENHIRSNGGFLRPNENNIGRIEDKLWLVLKI